jgi:UDP-N-acetylmuramate: L-alanyl-gamma-D-glutamyl-meso-diaminopimelate ligase
MKAPKRYHLIAIGGAVMHNMALALHAQGHRISGSDDRIRDPSRSRLDKAGLLPSAEGWFPERIDPALDGVILGMHAREDNPELAKAQSLGLPIWSFPAFVYEQSQHQQRIAICGSHGKTSITAMVMAVFEAASMPFDYLVGAKLEGYPIMVRLGTAPRIVLEGDEYLASPLDRRPKFAHYRPQIALISGIAWDHVNVYPTYESYLDAFRGLIRGMEAGSHLVYNAEDATLVRLIAELAAEGQCKAQTHPYECPPYRVDHGRLWAQWPDGERPMTVIGRHNLLNAAGAAKVAELEGVPPAAAAEALARFPGAALRLQVMGQTGGRCAIRDFAHAPSKVKASTDAVAEQFGPEALLAVLELHTFSSLNPEFMPAYRGSLDAAGSALVYYNPEAVAAKRLPELRTEQVHAALGRADLEVFTDAKALEARIQALHAERSALLLMSSGGFGGLDLVDLARQWTD